MKPPRRLAFRSRRCGVGRPKDGWRLSIRLAVTAAMISPSCGQSFFWAADAASRKTIAYARVSSHDQKEDLERQKQVLELYCARQGWTFEVIADPGSGMNYRKKGLKRLLDDVIDGHAGRLVITHKDRLLRFGAELIFAICEAKNVEVVILNQGEDTTFEEDLAKDVQEIITVFSARLYGSRSRKNQKLLDGVKKAVEESAAC